MPSGPKKRKAAKKKKEKEANTNATAHSQGTDDLKAHDERESDGGEVSSPASQDHHNHHHPFIEGEEEEKSDTSSVRSFVAENKSMEGVPNYGEGTQKIVAEDEGVVEIVRELKSDLDSGSKTVIIDYVESAKKSLDGSSSSSSSSSSSDDESQVVEKNSAVAESVKLTEEAYNPVSETAPLDESVKPVVSSYGGDALVGENCNSVVETIPVVDLVQPVVSLSEEVIHVTESAPVENENVANLLPLLDEDTGVSLDKIDFILKKSEDNVFPSVDENAGTSSIAMDFLSKENEDKLLQSSNAPNVETRHGAEHIKDSEIPESSENQPLVASAPRTVEKTSWKSCCGLFEVLAGSNR